MAFFRRLALLATALIVFVASGPATADAKSAKRVVALEWEYVENLLAVGVLPVGAADLEGMEEQTSIDVPGTIEDVGTRKEPNLQRIAALKPDLIIAPKLRIAQNRSQLEKIAPLLVLDAYPSTGGKDAHYKTMETGIKKVAKAVGRTSRADAVLRDLDRTYTRLRATLEDAMVDGEHVTVATAGGSAGKPATRIFTKNSLTAGVLRRLGLKPGYPVSDAVYGFQQSGIEAFRKCKIGYLIFAFPEQYADEADAFVSEPTWKALPIVKAKRVRTIPGNSWPYGGPLSTKVLAERIVGALVL